MCCKSSPSDRVDKMANNQRTLVLFTALLCLSGCGSAPSYDLEVAGVRRLQGIDGRLFVYRLSGDGDKITSGVRVDDEVVGRAVPGGFFYVDLPAGDYRVAASRNTDHVVPLRLAAGETRYIRVDLWLRRTRWTFLVDEVDEATALSELRRTSYVGGNP